MKRKIAGSVNIRINLGNYSHVEVIKYAEQEIEFANDQERIEKEDALDKDVIENVYRSLKFSTEKIGKGEAVSAEVEETLKKTIPAWLENNPIPNLVNPAAKREVQVAALQKEEIDNAKPAKNVQIFDEDASKKAEDLFEKDPVEKDKPQNVVVEEVAGVAGKADDHKENDIFDDFDK